MHAWDFLYYGGAGWLLIQEVRMVLAEQNGNMQPEQPL